MTETFGIFIREKPFTIHLFSDDNARSILMRCVSVYVDKSTNINNGDRIHYVYIVSDPSVWGVINVKFIYEPGIYVVSGLSEP